MTEIVFWRLDKVMAETGRRQPIGEIAELGIELSSRDKGAASSGDYLRSRSFLPSWRNSPLGSTNR